MEIESLLDLIDGRYFPPADEIELLEMLADLDETVDEEQLPVSLFDLFPSD